MIKVCSLVLQTNQHGFNDVTVYLWICLLTWYYTLIVQSPARNIIGLFVVFTFNNVKVWQWKWQRLTSLIVIFNMKL